MSSDALTPAASHDPADVAQRARAVAALAPDSGELARLLAGDPAPHVRIAAAHRCADLTPLASAWEHETDPDVRAALAVSLGRALSVTADTTRATALLRAEHCTDAIRCEVARTTVDPHRRRIAIASIRDELALFELTQARVATEAHVHDAVVTPAAVPAGDDAAAARLRLYVPRALQQHLAHAPSQRHWTAEGSALFSDISGFTELSERLSRKGREGAEQIAETIDRIFEAILEVAYAHGGSLLKFGGDALLLWFDGDGHAPRAARASMLMRRVLRDVGRLELPGARLTLRISQGLHSGVFNFFAAGDAHVELLPVGPNWSRLVLMEQTADAGEILASPECAERLPDRCAGAAKSPGRLLRREPPDPGRMPLAARPPIPRDALARCLAPALRAHVEAGGGTSEHRHVTIAFIRFEGTDALLARDGAAATADALHALVREVAAAADAHGVTFLGSDVDADGGKLILVAGAPKVAGDEEERLLLAARRIVSAGLPLAIRVGVHRGPVFAGDIGPGYRRTYTVMGDAVNLAARLMASAGDGAIYATAGVLERSDTLFRTSELAPFRVKGKAQPVRAWSVGPAVGSRTQQGELARLPLVGRAAELETLRQALVRAEQGAGTLLEIVGEAGIGKSRMLEALREAAGARFRALHVTCEAYTSSTPYTAWRELIRDVLGGGREDADAAVAQRLRDAVAANAPELAPWLPLLGIAAGVDIPMTPEVEALAEKNRRARLNETVAHFLAVAIGTPTLIQFENAQQMDEASADLLGHLAAEIGSRPWVIGVARRSGDRDADAVREGTVRVELAALDAGDAMLFAKLATREHPLPKHVLEVVARRSGGNPQFLHDLLRSAIDSGGVGGLPDSAEAAAMARIDALSPEDRQRVRRASVLGLTFHPRMLGWFADEDGDADAMPAGGFERLTEIFDDDGDGYLRFRRSLLRDAAYEGLPYRTRRALHRVVATRLTEELDNPEDAANILSLHWHAAGVYDQAWHYAAVAARRAQAAYAYVEAAELYSRALDAGRRLPDVAPHALADVHASLGDAWDRAGEFRKASDAYGAARRLAGRDALAQASLLLKRSRIEEKLGKYPQALRWAARARRAIDGVSGSDAARHAARTSAWYATVLQAEGRAADALRWAQRSVTEAEAAGDDDALGAAYFVMGWAYGETGREGAEPLLQRSLDAYRRAGNLVRQAALLSNLGVVCQWEGRWDEAMSYYRRGREESLRIGNAVEAAVSSINLAEILTDRGELDEANALLEDALPLWRASAYRYFLGACLALLGRVALRAGRIDEALDRFAEAKQHFSHVGSEPDVLDVDARIAECRVYRGESADALALAADALARARSADGFSKSIPLLERVRGYALLQQGERGAARTAIDAGLSAARSRNDPFEVMLALDAIARVASLDGRPVDAAVESERDALVARLRIGATPAWPPGLDVPAG